MSPTRPGRRLAFVLWNGDVGGAETVSVSLAREMSLLGAEVTLVFIEQPQPLAQRLAVEGVSYTSLGFPRGRDILRHPRRYAREIAAAGPDGALLIECGFMGAALRCGGYRAPIVAVEHGAILAADHKRGLRRLAWRAARVSGAWADDVEVAVSDFVLRHMREQPHAGVLRRIHNGIEPERFTSQQAVPTSADADRFTVAFAARLIAGKGADHLIEAVGRMRSERPVTLLIAGEGPERTRLESLTRWLPPGRRVEFLGLTHDMPAFWRSGDVVAIPSAAFTEACPMAPLEAMASGRPVVATRNGGLAEIVIDGKTGILVTPGDSDAVADALRRYADSPELCRADGERGRARVLSSFQIAGCARAYLELFDEIATRRARAPLGGLRKLEPRDVAAQ